MKATEKVPQSIQMHMRPIEGSNIKMIRSDIVMQDVDQSQFIGFCDDFENQQKDQPHLIEMKVFEKKEGSSLIYSHSKMPLMSARDSLISFERFK